MNALKYIAGKLFSNGKEVLTEDSIESGTINGSIWTKYPDGTLVLARKNGSAYQAPGTKTGSLYFSKNKYTITFADYLPSGVNFIDAPVVTATYLSAKLSNGLIFIHLREIASDNFGFYVVSSLDKESPGSIDWIAIGRWK